LFGKQIQQSILGGIMVELKKLPQTSMIDRYFPSTKKCLGCGKKNPIKLNERIYSCSCGYEEDRDIHSSNSILIESFNITQIPMECRKFKPVELNTSALEKLINSTNVYKKVFYKGKYKFRDFQIKKLLIHTDVMYNVFTLPNLYQYMKVFLWFPLLFYQ